MCDVAPLWVKEKFFWQIVTGEVSAQRAIALVRRKGAIVHWIEVRAKLRERLYFTLLVYKPDPVPHEHKNVSVKPMDVLSTASWRFVIMRLAVPPFTLVARTWRIIPIVHAFSSTGW